MKITIGNDLDAAKFWIYNTGTIHNDQANKEVWRGAFALETSVWNSFVGQRITSIKGYEYPDKIDNKLVTAFPDLSMVYISHRSCYQVSKTCKQPITVKRNIGSGTRMVTEVLAMLYEKKSDGTYKAMFPIVIWTIGHQARLILENINIFADQLKRCTNGTRNIFQYVLDYYIDDDTLRVGKDQKKSVKYNNVKSEIYPIELFPEIRTNNLESIDPAIVKELASRRISEDDYKRIAITHDKAIKSGWSYEWDEGSTFMRSQKK